MFCQNDVSSIVLPVLLFYSGLFRVPPDAYVLYLGSAWLELLPFILHVKLHDICNSPAYASD